MFGLVLYCTRAGAAESIVLAAAICGLSGILVILLISEGWGYLSLIPLIPFGQSLPIVGFGVRAVNLGMDTVLIVILLVWHLLWRKRTDKTIHLGKVSIVLLLWTGWNLVSIVLSLQWLQPQQALQSFVVFMRWGQYVPVFLLLANGKLDHRQAKATLPVLTVTGLLAALLGIYQFIIGYGEGYLKGSPSFTVPLFREADVVSQFGDSGIYQGSANYNVAAAYLLVALLMMIPFVSAFGRRKHRFGGFMAGIVLFLGILSTFSRSGLLACLVGLLVIAYQKSKRQFFATMFGTALLGAMVFLMFPNQRFIIELRETITGFHLAVPMALSGEAWSLSSNISATVLGAALRVAGMRDAWLLFLQHPGTGCGFYGYQYFGFGFTPDNYFFQLLAETGLAGFLLMVWFFSSLAGTLRMRQQDGFLESYRIGLMATLIAMLIVNLTGGIFYIQKIWGPFLMVAGVWLGLLNQMNDE